MVFGWLSSTKDDCLARRKENGYGAQITPIELWGSWSLHEIIWGEEEILEIFRQMDCRAVRCCLVKFDATQIFG
jgi:hypothetical protein